MGRSSAGSLTRILGRYSLDNNYPAGGYTLDPKAIGLTRLDSFFPLDNQFGYLYDFDSTTNKLKVLSAAGGAHTHAINFSAAIAFTPPALDAVRIYYTAGAGVFAIGDAVTDTTSGATGTVSAVNPGFYMDLTGVVAGAGPTLFQVNDALVSGIKTGTVSDYTGVAAIGAEATYYVYSFNTMTWPLGMVDTSTMAGTPITVVSEQGIPGTTTMVLLNNALTSQLEGIVLISGAGPNVQSVQARGITTPTASGGGAGAAGEVAPGTDLSAVVDAEFHALGA